MMKETQEGYQYSYRVIFETTMLQPYIVVYFGTTPRSAQVLLLALHSGIIPARAQEAM